MHRQPWANHVLDVNQEQLLDSARNHFPVHLIMSPKDQLITCSRSDLVRAVAARSDIGSYDYLPVLKHAQDDEIIGLVKTASIRPYGVGDQRIDTVMEPLGESNVISADAGILDFVMDADRRPCRLVVSGMRIAGLVTISDLQRLPVRPVLFLLITQFEFLMHEKITRCFPKQETGDDEPWLLYLEHRDQKRIRHDWNRAREESRDVEMILIAYLRDKLRIMKHAGLRTVDDWNDEFDDDVKWLRNKLAHASTYANTDHNAKRTARTVCKLTKIMRALGKDLFLT